MNAPLPENEPERLRALRRYEILDTPPEPALDQITREAAQIFGVPICLVSLVDENRNWFKSRLGLGIQEIRREASFCAHAILSDDVMVVPDARKDARFARNPLVTGDPGICFYAAAPLKTPDGFNLGTLCVLDTVARVGLTRDEAALLKSFAALVVSELELQSLIRLRRQAERARRGTEGLLAQVFGSAPVGLAITDKQGRFVKVNEAYCQLLGCAQQELIGQPLVATLSPASRELVERTGALSVEAPREGPTEWQVQRRDNGLVEVRVASSPLIGEDGSLFRVTVFTDITADKQLEEYLRWMDKTEALSDLAGHVARSFGNLLTIITGFSQLIKNSVEPDHASSGFASEILKATDRASVLTDQFLMLSGHRGGTPQVVDLNSVITSLEESLHQLIGHEIKLVTTLEPELRKVNAYPPQIVQLITNLIVNAREAMPSGGKIIVDTSNIELGQDFVRTHPNVKPGRYVLLTIQDTGEGMNSATRKRLFEPFFTTKEVGRGTGLAIVYGIVKRCGGLISVWSTPGKGTAIDVFLPAVQETAEPQKPEEPAETVRIKAVSLADHGQAAREAAGLTLEIGGYKSVEPRPAEVADPVRPPRNIRRTLFSVLLVLTFAALMGTLGDTLKPQSPLQPPAAAKAGASDAAALGLTARLEGGQLLLSWNSQAEPIKTADRAILSITDGGRKEDIELDPVVLRTKKLAYSPVTNDVTFRLLVTSLKHHTTASESLRVPAEPVDRMAAPAQGDPSSPNRSGTP